MHCCCCAVPPQECSHLANTTAAPPSGQITSPKNLDAPHLIPLSHQISRLGSSLSSRTAWLNMHALPNTQLHMHAHQSATWVSPIFVYLCKRGRLTPSAVSHSISTLPPIQGNTAVVQSPLAWLHQPSIANIQYDYVMQAPGPTSPPTLSRPPQPGGQQSWARGPIMACGAAATTTPPHLRRAWRGPALGAPPRSPGAPGLVYKNSA